jgi:hypothetical protein
MMKKMKKLLSRVLGSFCLKQIFNATKYTDFISALSYLTKSDDFILSFVILILFLKQSTLEQGLLRPRERF